MRSSKIIEHHPEITDNLVAIGGMSLDYVSRLQVEAGPVAEIVPNERGEKDKVANLDIPKDYNGSRPLSEYGPTRRINPDAPC